MRSTPNCCPYCHHFGSVKSCQVIYPQRATYFLECKYCLIRSGEYNYTDNDEVWKDLCLVAAIKSQGLRVKPEAEHCPICLSVNILYSPRTDTLGKVSYHCFCSDCGLITNFTSITKEKAYESFRREGSSVLRDVITKQCEGLNV